MARVMLLALLIGMSWWLPADAASTLPTYSGDQFEQLFSDAPLDVAEEIGVGDIVGNPLIDARIRALAEARGYRLRPQATTELVSIPGGLIHPEAAAAWDLLRAAADAAGHSIRIVSGYRTYEQQRSLFLSRLTSHSDTAIDTRLRWSAPPGYSKHHTGYAVDLAVAGSDHQNFGSTGAYRWLAADNYHNAKRFGFIPSYPPDAAPGGPNPEPWEWLYVGVELIKCRGDLTCDAVTRGQGTALVHTWLI
ncbi:hypothetical protein BH23ACT5_BH23ACT5_24000 [soil metagenome]